MNQPDSAIRALAEIALRVSDLDAMARFYEDAIGLELMQRFDAAVFFKIAPGHAGHTQILALFDRSNVDPDEPRPYVRGSPKGLCAECSTFDHLAFSIDRADYDSELTRLRNLGLEVHTAQHEWVQWRSIYVDDPEGNLVELVCFDEPIKPAITEE